MVLPGGGACSAGGVGVVSGPAGRLRHLTIATPSDPGPGHQLRHGGGDVGGHNERDALRGAAPFDPLADAGPFPWGHGCRNRRSTRDAAQRSASAALTKSWLPTLMAGKSPRAMAFCTVVALVPCRAAVPVTVNTLSSVMGVTAVLPDDRRRVATVGGADAS
jgi:hypothetical protein